jgi:hypothetical protein
MAFHRRGRAAGNGSVGRGLIADSRVGTVASWQRPSGSVAGTADFAGVLVDHVIVSGSMRMVTAEPAWAAPTPRWCMRPARRRLILPRRQSGNRTGESPVRSESTRSGDSGIRDLGRADGHKRYQCDGPLRQPATRNRPGPRYPPQARSVWGWRPASAERYGSTPPHRNIAHRNIAQPPASAARILGTDAPACAG